MRTVGLKSIKSKRADGTVLEVVTDWAVEQILSK